MGRTRPSVLILLLPLLALTPAACANWPSGPEVAPPSAAVRARLGTIAVVPSVKVLRQHATTPVAGSGRGAGAGALQGGFGAIGVGGAAGGPYGLILGIFLSPVFAIGGAVVGASAAHDEAEVVEAAATLRRILDERQPSIGLRDALVAGGRDSGRTMTGHEPGADAAALAATGIDTVLDLEVMFFGLGTEGSIDPDVRLFLTARARLVRAGDGSPIYERAWRYNSGWFDYFDAAKDGGAPLEARITAAIDVLSAAMIDDLFLSETATPIRWTEGADGGQVVTIGGPLTGGGRGASP